MKNWLVIAVTVIIVAGFAWASMDKTPAAKDTPQQMADPHANVDMGDPVEPITVLEGDVNDVIFKLDDVNVTRGTLNVNMSRMLAGVPIVGDSLDDEGRFKLVVTAVEKMLWREITTREMNDRGLVLEDQKASDEEVEELLNERAISFGGMDKMEAALEEMHPGAGLEAMRRLIRRELNNAGKMTLDDALYEDITRDVTLTDEELASFNGDKQYLETASSEYDWTSYSMADAETQEELLETKKALVFDDWVARAQTKLVQDKLVWVDDKFKTYFSEHDLIDMLKAAAESRQQHDAMPAPHGAMPGMMPGMGGMGGMSGMGGGMGGMGMGGMTMPPGHPPMPGAEGPGADADEEVESAD